jgi:hypothetical protein
MRMSSIWILLGSALGLGLAGMLAGCYAPELRPGAPCKSDTQCPSGQQCIAGSCSASARPVLDASYSVAHDAAPSTDTATTDAAEPSGCQSSDQCATAMSLGAMSGDTGHPTVTAQGSRAAWLRVRVTEDDDTVEGIPMSVLAKLTSPAGAAFEVLLHVNADSDVLECSTTTGTTTTTGNVKQVRASWGEDVVADGVDDSRDLAIEIRPISGTCDSGATWQLSVEGNPG